MAHGVDVDEWELGRVGTGRNFPSVAAVFGVEERCFARLMHVHWDDWVTSLIGSSTSNP